jgi:hypothetical protein
MSKKMSPAQLAELMWPWISWFNLGGFILWAAMALTMPYWFIWVGCSASPLHLKLFGTVGFLWVTSCAIKYVSGFLLGMTMVFTGNSQKFTDVMNGVTSVTIKGRDIN